MTTLLAQLLAFLVIISFLSVHSFIPASIVNNFVSTANKQYNGNLGEISSTLTHDEILKRGNRLNNQTTHQKQFFKSFIKQQGIIRSIMKFFYDQPGGRQKINFTKIDTYYDVYSLFYDNYGKWYCSIGFIEVFELEFRPNVAVPGEYV